MALVLLAAAVGVAGRVSDEGSAGGKTSESSPAPAVGSLLAEAPVGDEVRGLVAAMGSEAVGQTGHLSELPAAEEAGRVLDEYAARGDCVVARSGWLDLLGRTYASSASERVGEARWASCAWPPPVCVEKGEAEAGA